MLDERKRLLDAELRRFANEPERSLMFFYFSSIDQRHHMLYREADPTDPLRPRRHRGRARRTRCATRIGRSTSRSAR